jgi:hypothetical protein
MSVQRARQAIRGEPTDCIPLFDTPTHRLFLQHLTGIDPFAKSEKAAERAVVEAIRKLDIDLLMCDIPEQITVSDADPNLFGLGTTAWRNAQSTRSDLFAYDPARDRPWDTALSETEFKKSRTAQFQRIQRLVGDTALAHGFFFTTCIHYAAEDLNWEDFFIACVTEEDRVATLLDRFQAASAKVMRAWADIGPEVMLAHDDIATAHGTSLSPDWLRKHILPRYRAILAPFKKKHIPVMFMTDGNFSAVAQDLVEAGADGFFLDRPCMDLAALANPCGPDLIYFTGPAPATMTVGTPADVRREIRELAEVGRDLPRFFFHMPGGFTHTMPLANVVAFYEACREYGRR